MISARIHTLRKSMAAQGLHGYFTTSVSNITYLTGFNGDSSRLLVSSERVILITDGRYTEQASRECPEYVEIFKWLENKRYHEHTYSYLIDKMSIRQLAFEENEISYTEYQTLKRCEGNFTLSPILGMVETIRQQKDETEITALQTACKISELALEETLPYIREGITELELTAQLEYRMKMNGAQGLSFDTLILSGSRTSLLHGKPGTRKLEKGDFVLFDFGAMYSGYHADISRTFILGTPTNKQSEIYNIIKNAQAAAVASLKAGISVRVPDEAVRQHLPDTYLEYYYPGLGHGVGLQIHEQPFLGAAYEGIIQENTLLTIEPGIYIPGWGGLRIEDTVWVKQDNSLCLSTFPRELMVL